MDIYPKLKCDDRKGWKTCLHHDNLVKAHENRQKKEKLKYKPENIFAGLKKKCKKSKKKIK
jgi:hypothetical protein